MKKTYLINLLTTDTDLEVEMDLTSREAQILNEAGTIMNRLKGHEGEFVCSLSLHEVYIPVLRESLEWLKLLKSDIEDVGYYYYKNCHDIEHLENIVIILEGLVNKEED
jgi:hypothetical protein